MKKPKRKKEFSKSYKAHGMTFTYNKELDKYEDIDRCPEKTKMANEILSRISNLDEVLGRKPRS